MVHDRNIKLASYTFLTINDTEDMFPGEILQKIEAALIQPIANVSPTLFCHFFFIYLLLSSCFLFLSRNLLLSSSNCSLSSTSILCSMLEIDLDPVLRLEDDLDLALKLEVDLDLALRLEIDLDLALGPARNLLERSWLSSSTFCRRRLLGLVPDLIGVFKAFLSYQDPKFHNVKWISKTIVVCLTKDPALVRRPRACQEATF